MEITARLLRSVLDERARGSLSVESQARFQEEALAWSNPRLEAWARELEEAEGPR